MKSKTGELPEDVEEDGSSEICPERKLDKLLQVQEKPVLTDRNGEVDKEGVHKKKNVMNPASEQNGSVKMEPFENVISDKENVSVREADENDDLSDALSKCSLSDMDKPNKNDADNEKSDKGNSDKADANDEDDIIGKISNLQVKDEADDEDDDGKCVVIKSSDIKTQEDIELQRLKEAEDKTAIERGPTGGVPVRVQQSLPPNYACQIAQTNFNFNQQVHCNNAYHQLPTKSLQSTPQYFNSKRGRDDFDEQPMKFTRPVEEKINNLNNLSKPQMTFSNVVSTQRFCGGQVVVQSPEEEISPIFSGTTTSGEFDLNFLEDKTYLECGPGQTDGNCQYQKTPTTIIGATILQNSYPDQSTVNLRPMMEAPRRSGGKDSPTSFSECDASEGYGSDALASPYSEQQDSPGTSDMSVYTHPPSNDSGICNSMAPSPGSQVDLCSPRSNMSGYETNADSCHPNSPFSAFHQGTPTSSFQQVQNIPNNHQPLPQVYHPTMTGSEYDQSAYINENLADLKDVMDTIAHDMIESEQTKQKRAQNAARQVQNAAQHSPNFVQHQQNIVQQPQNMVNPPQNVGQHPQNMVQHQQPQNMVQHPQNIGQPQQYMVQTHRNVDEHQQNMVHHSHKTPILPQQKPLSASQDMMQGRPVANVLPVANPVNNIMPPSTSQLYFVGQQPVQKSVAPAVKPVPIPSQSKASPHPAVTTSQILVIPAAPQPTQGSAIVIVAQPMPAAKKVPQFRRIQPKIESNPAPGKTAATTNSKQAARSPSNKSAAVTLSRPMPTGQPPVAPVQPAQRPRSANQAAKTNINQLNIARRLVATMTTDDLKYTDKDGDTFLHVAVCKADKYMVQALLERLDREHLQSMIDTQNVERQSPVYLAVSANQPEMVAMFNKYGADVNLLAERVSSNGQKEIKAPIHCASSNGREYLQTLKALLDSPDLNLNMFNSDGCTALHCAILEHNQPRLAANQDAMMDLKTDSRPIIEALIKAGADPNAQDKKSGKTPLMYAMEIRDYILLETLLGLVDVTKVRLYFRTQAFDGSTCVKIMESRKSEFPQQLYEKLSSIMSNSRAALSQRMVVDVQ